MQDEGTRLEPADTKSPATGARSAPRLGVWARSFVGVVAATVIVVIAFGAVSEIVLPLPSRRFWQLTPIQIAEACLRVILSG